MIARVLTLVALLTASAFALPVTREKAEELAAKVPADDPWEKFPDASQLAWNEAYTIHAFLDLYEATGDLKYLDPVVSRGDRMISHRDDKRNFATSDGIVHKRWSIGSKYTIGEVVLNDAKGKPCIKLRSVLFAYNHLTDVEVTSNGNSFAVHLTNRRWKRDETFDDLSMDPASPRYFQRIINDPKPRARPFTKEGKCTEASQLLRATPVGEHPDPPADIKTSLKPLTLAHVGYVGIICHPLLRFAADVKRDPALASQSGLAEAAKRFVTAAEESFDDIEPNWRNGYADDEGYYIGCERGGADAYDGVGEAFNYLGKLASSQVLLFDLTGKPRYKDHATRMASLFKHRLKLVEGAGGGDRYVWCYWYEPITRGWKAADDISINSPDHEPWSQIEDTSHRALDIGMAADCAAAGWIFDQTDMKRFAGTFLQKVVLPDRSGFYAHVDGTDPNSGYKDTRVVGWLPLAGSDPRVLDLCRQVYDTRADEDFRSIACLLKWESRLAKRTSLDPSPAFPERACYLPR